MATSNVELMRLARESLSGKWGQAIGTFLLYMVIVGALSATSITSVASLIVSGPFALGMAGFTLSLSRGLDARLEQMFDGFKLFGNALVTYLLMFLYVLLWMLCLIVPGIIAAMSYSMAFFILADEPSLKPREVLDRSKRMMDGYKLKLFYLYMRFFLLSLLCILTLGIGFLWLIPYAYVTFAKFYDDIKDNKVGLQ